MVGDAGIEFVNGSANWNFNRKNPVAAGVALLAQTLQGGLVRLNQLLGGNVDMHLQIGDPGICQGSSVCALPPYVRNANGAFTIQWSAAFIDGQDATFVGGTAVHELAHVMDWRSFEAAGGTPNNLFRAVEQSFSARWWPYASITDYAACLPGDCIPAWEKWAEAVAYSVYGARYVADDALFIDDFDALTAQMGDMSNLLNGVR